MLLKLDPVRHIERIGTRTAYKVLVTNPKAIGHTKTNYWSDDNVETD
jgi:hypothetical protein